MSKFETIVSSSGRDLEELRNRAVAFAAIAGSVFGGAAQAQSAATPTTPDLNTALAVATLTRSGVRDGFVETGIQPYFIKHAVYKPWEMDFGISQGQMDKVIDTIWGTMSRSSAVDHVPGRSVNDTAKVIRRAVDGIMAEHGITSPSRLLHQWIVAEGVCAWVQMRASYSMAQYNKDRDAFPAQKLLDMNVPSGVCADTALLTRDLARVAGSDIGLQSHWVRLGRALKAEANPVVHAVPGFTFEGGVRSIADNVPYNTRVFLDRKPYNGWCILPRTRESMELVMGCFRIQARRHDDQGDAQDLYTLDARFLPSRPTNERLDAIRNWRTTEQPVRQRLGALQAWWSKNYPWSY